MTPPDMLRRDRPPRELWGKEVVETLGATQGMPLARHVSHAPSCGPSRRTGCSRRLIGPAHGGGRRVYRRSASRSRLCPTGCYSVCQSMASSNSSASGSCFGRGSGGRIAYPSSTGAVVPAPGGLRQVLLVARTRGRRPELRCTATSSRQNAARVAPAPRLRSIAIPKTARSSSRSFASCVGLAMPQQ